VPQTKCYQCGKYFDIYRDEPQGYYVRAINDTGDSLIMCSRVSHVMSFARKSILATRTEV
jgi:hypothetical protein